MADWSEIPDPRLLTCIQTATRQISLFFKKGKKIIVTNAFRKQSQKLPQGEKNLALKNMADYLSRNPDTEETK